MKLIDAIAQNKYLYFTDSADNKDYTLDSLFFHLNEITNLQRGLAFLYLDNQISSVALYLSFLKSEHCIVLLNKALDEALKINLEQEYNPLIIYDESRTGIPDMETLTIQSTRLSTHLHVSKGKSSPIHPNCKVLLSTSGSTGSPKFVKLSDDNLLQNALSIIDYLPINNKDVAPLNLPLYYSYGLSVLHSNAIAGGNIACGLPDILQREFWTLMDTFGFTSLAGVPYIYEMLIRIGFLKKTYPSLKYLTQAGGNLSSTIKIRLLEYCRANGIELFIMYGQTEATARISFVPPGDLEHKIASIGKPIKNGILSLDPESGELLYRGPNVFGGYASKKEDLISWEQIDTLRTGDLAEQDPEGYFFIKGRLKRFVKIYGNRVNLDEIESFIKGLLNGSMLACTGINDKYILVAHANPDQDESLVKQHIFDRYKIHPSSVKLKHIAEFPLTSNGKVNYKKITADYLEEMGELNNFS